MKKYALDLCHESRGQDTGVLYLKFLVEPTCVGRSPWTAADARVGRFLTALQEPDQGSGADAGVRPTRSL